MSEELQEVIDRKSLWIGYEISSNEQVKNIIKYNINQMCNNWISIGFALKQARDKEFYKEDGYSCIQDYAYDEFGIKKQRVSKLIKIIETLSVNGNAPVLEDKWKDFSIAKLEEIIYLDEDEREEVIPVMTKVQIRNIGKSNDEEVSPAKLEAVTKVCKWDGKSNCVAVCDTGIECCAECKEHGHCNTECGWQEERIPKPSGQCIHRPDFPCTLPEASKLAKGDGVDCNAKCCWNCSNREGCGYQCNSSAHRPVADKQPEIVNDIPESANDEANIPEKECANCNYNDMDPDEYRRGHLVDKTEFPCNTCDDKLNHWEPEVDGLIFDCFNQEEGWHKEVISDKPEEVENELPCDTCGYDMVGGCDYPNTPDDYCVLGDRWKPNDKPVETVEADIVQTVPEEVKQGTNYSLNAVYTILQKAKADYEEVIKVAGAPKTLTEKRLIIRDALLDYYKELRGRDTAWYINPQPELPILKNNDQRKDFIDAYETWPIWIDQKETGERYYRYNLSDKVAMVVKVSRKHCWNNYKETNDYEYAAEQYYLLGIRYEYGLKGSVFTEDESRTFYECSTNKTALVDYLKEIQKKG